MRIDLTPGAFRILQKASEMSGKNGISVAMLALALFDETECRAYQWMTDAGITQENLRLKFGLYEELDQPLQMPISAPTFPIGSYGVPIGTAATTPDYSKNETVNISEKTQGNYPPNTPFTPRTERSVNSDDKHGNQERRERFAKDPPDTLAPFRHHTRERVEKQKRESSISFYLDDGSVHFSSILPELEIAIYTMLERIRKTSHTPETPSVLGAGGVFVRIKPTAIGFIDPAFQLATEHLLLAVLLAEDSLGIGDWFREQGLDPKIILDRVNSLNYRAQEFPFEKQIPESETETILKQVSVEQIEPEPISAAQISPADNRKFIRLLDASANRAIEGIRVIEDYVRFMLDDSRLTKLLKDFRHDFASAMRILPATDRISSRDTTSDVGTEIQGSNEYKRSSVIDVLASNFSRLQESLRSLEEFSKIISVSLAGKMESLRYRSYTIHKDVMLSAFSYIPQLETEFVEKSPTICERISNASLYVLLDCRETKDEFRKLVEDLIEAGTNCIQLRDKKASDRMLMERGKILRELTLNTNTLFIMNDRPDLTKMCEADGVHIGQDEITVSDVRKYLGDGVLIGVSTHDVSQACQAVTDGADYIGVGPVFASNTKEFTEFPGIDFLREVAEEIKIPAFAIGGINSENLREIIDAGIRRIAVASAIIDAVNPKDEIKRLKSMLTSEMSTEKK